MFKTRNGRGVLDGGGVKPDVVLDKKTDYSIIRDLRRKNLIFDFVTQFCLKHPEIPAVTDFEFTQFNEFI